MIRRLLLLAVTLSLTVAATHAWAQQTNKIPVVGILALAAGPADPIYKGFRQGLRELGYEEGRNIRIEYRGAQGHVDRLPRLAQELVQLKVDVILVGNTPSAEAVQGATSTVPIVIATSDPLAFGLVTNIARPGGNVTGLSLMMADLTAKRLQLLKETIPQLTRLAVLWNLDTPYHKKVIQDLEAAAPSLSLELTLVAAQAPEQFIPAFAAFSRARAQALYVIEDPVFYNDRVRLVGLATKARLPIVYWVREFAEAGGLMSYGANYSDLMRQSVRYVDKILKGAKPGDLPIEQPTKIEFVVNLKTAKALGIKIPQSILLRADEVIR